MSQTTDLPAGIRRVTAPNPGPMTYQGTNSYLIGTAEVILVDPGPRDAAHLSALVAAVGAGRVRQILVTHAHRDHSAGVGAVAAAFGHPPVLAFGGATKGRSALMEELALRPGLEGGEGLDHAFAPDETLSHGAVLHSELGPLVTLHTPGHLSSHMCFALPDVGVIFTGDTVMGWSTTLISPPDGSVSAFRASLDLLRARQERLYLPGHGPAVADGPALATKQVAHRVTREAQIVTALQDGPATPADLTARIYAAIPKHLHPVAARNVLAHLIDLAEQGQVRLPDGALSTARYSLLKR